MLNGSFEALATSPVTTPVEPDTVFERIAETRRAVAADLKLHDADSWADVHRAMTALCTTAPRSNAGFRAWTQFFREFKPLQQLLRADTG
jgi:hypothetical protein